MPVDDGMPLPGELPTYQLLRLGLSLHDIDNEPVGRLRELLAIDAAYRTAEGSADA